jgi:hypothetical protein
MNKVDVWTFCGLQRPEVGVGVDLVEFGEVTKVEFDRDVVILGM